MTADELMIGDIFMTLHVPFRLKAWKDSQEGHMIATNMHEEDFHVWVEDIQPIPLTDEILKKNGFIYNPETTGYPNITTPPYYTIENSPRIYCDGNPFSVWFEDEVKIEYVHQLQHLLKFCNINKEIKL